MLKTCQTGAHGRVEGQTNRIYAERHSVNRKKQNPFVGEILTAI